MARPALIDRTTLEMALVGYDQERVKIEAKIADIHTQLGTATPALAVTDGAATKKHTRSASVRRRMALAQRKRWAAAKEAEQKKPAKRKMSAAARKRIADATRKRWAAFRKAKAAAAKKGKPRKSTPKAQKPTVPTAATPTTA